MLVPPRRFDPEIMDRPDNDPRELRRALRDLAWVNRRLGGRRALLRALAPHLARGRTVLDVGTGGGDLVAAMEELGLRVTAVELDPVSAREAAARGPVVRADARRLPFATGAFDLVTVSLVLHHFGPPEIPPLLRELRRVARRAVLVNDLRRHRIPWAAFGILARATRRSPMVVHDGPLSILRGFTESELADAARAAGAPARPRRVWPFRLVLDLPGGGA